MSDTIRDETEEGLRVNDRHRRNEVNAKWPYGIVSLAASVAYCLHAPLPYVLLAWVIGNILIIINFQLLADHYQREQILQWTQEIARRLEAIERKMNP